MDSVSLKKNELIRLIREKSYRTGDFQLASGKKSSFYVDLKTTSLHPQGAALISDLLVEEVISRKWAIEGVGGLTLGADPIATAVSLEAHRRGLYWPAFIVRKEPKSHGTSQYIEGVDNLKPKSRLLILEDVTTTGGSSLKAVDRLRSEGFVPQAIATVVDREMGAQDKIANAGLEFISLVRLSEIQKAH